MTLTDTVTVWTSSQGIPERFIWGGRRYRVSDRPTPLDLDYTGITHPPAAPVAWRFQGTSEEGDTRIFDVLYSQARQEWDLLRTYR